MYQFNDEEGIEFNSSGCGIALPLQEGNRLITTGIQSCVVLQVLSDDYFFAAHVTEINTSNENLPLFCNQVKEAFANHNSSIRECTLWHTENQDGKDHPLGIMGSVHNHFDGATTKVMQISSNNRVNSSLEIVVTNEGSIEAGPKISS